ncbi:MAG TPA: AEC family transporter [Roseiflexaceae bacterium]|jgi:predicted permease|nr:AEC family transporter [Roseiflexaceae bacterium]
MGQLFAVLFNVLVPVFALVLLGYMVGPRLQFDARTLSRFAYFVLTPAFVFNMLSTARVEAAQATRMVGYISAVYIATAVVAFIAARLLRRSAQMTTIYVMVAIFGNVGNFGLPIVQFALGKNALVPGTIYFIANIVLAFVVCVAAANFGRGSSLRAMGAVLRTPALLALVPALAWNWSDAPIPAFLARPIDLLASALIPTMLIVLGVQLASAGVPRLDFDMVFASLIRLVGGALLGFALLAPFGLAGLEGHVGVLQSSMPAAVLISIIALENDIMPEFVTATVLFSNLLSAITLAIVLILL